MKLEHRTQTSQSIAHDYNFYMLFWVFVLFSVFGFCFESLANLIEYGEFHNRQGILYLPFSQVYGLGAIVIIEATRWIKTKGIGFLFIFCAVFGAFFEYVVSYIEEMVLHSTTWDYSNMPFNIDGRTNLLFSLAWGAVGVLIVKVLFPLSVKVIDRIRGKSGLVLTWFIFIILAGDILLSSAMVYRAYERRNEIPATNVVQEFLDKYYPDSVVFKTYPSLRFK